MFKTYNCNNLAYSFNFFTGIQWNQGSLQDASHQSSIISFSVFFSGNIDPGAGSHYELDEEPAGDNAYDSVGPVGTSSGKSKPPEKNTLPPVYAAVDKNNRQGNTVS